MADWFEHTLLPALIALGVLLLVLWPTRYSGTRLLKNWGIAEPAAPQVDEAVRYLRRRRILFAVLFLTVPPVAGLAWPGPDDNQTALNLFVPLLVAMLVAELVATLRPVSGVRVASLDPRGWRDLLPRWAIATGAVFAVLAVGLAGLALAAQPWAARYVTAPPPEGVLLVVDSAYQEMAAWTVPLLILGSVVLCLAVVGTLVHLAVRRPSSADEVVDAALRTRTARVAVAIGFGWLGASVNQATQRLNTLVSLDHGQWPAPDRPGWLTGDLVDVLEVVGLVSLLAGIVCWMWLAMPTRRSLARVRMQAG